MNARRLIGLYPRKWRERYGAELLALAEDSHLSGPRLAMDLIAGALREQLRAAVSGVSPAKRQRSLNVLVMMLSWGAGVVTCAALALVLPDTQKGGTARSTFWLLGILSTIGVVYFLRARKSRKRVAFAGEFLSVTAPVGLLVLMALTTIVYGGLELAHTVRAGHVTVAELLQSSASRSTIWAVIGRTLAGMFWPDKFGDRNAPEPPSTPGLGA